MIIKIILLALLPISELRGTIPYGIVSGVNPWSVYVIAVLANFFVVPLGIFFLDLLHDKFYKIKIYRKLFDSTVERGRKKVEGKIGTSMEFVTFMLLVAIPLPMTGAYSATLLGWFFEIDRRRLYLSIFSGLLIAGLIVSALTLGFF